MENKKGVYQNTLATAATAGSLDMSAGLPRQVDLQVSGVRATQSPNHTTTPSTAFSNTSNSMGRNSTKLQQQQQQHMHPPLHQHNSLNTNPIHPVAHSLLLQQQQQIRMLQYDMRVPPITSPMSSPTATVAATPVGHHHHVPHSSAHPHHHDASSYLHHHHHQSTLSPYHSSPSSTTHNNKNIYNNNPTTTIYGNMHSEASPTNVSKNIHPNPMHDLHMQQAHRKYAKQHNNTIYHQLNHPQQQQQSNLLMYQQAQSPVWVPQQSQSPIYQPHQVIVAGAHKAPEPQQTTNSQRGQPGDGATIASAGVVPQTANDGSVARTKESLERKRSGGAAGGNQQLRSPSAKRPPNAPVAMQGWLYKQGSDGLMLWKKRWFVLSEYCMFYYKGPEEEKLLGSILLPSYKVSICNLDDRVNRKYAFKCEHTNMRTYLLAADSQELTMHWIRLINLACLLQSNAVDEQSTPRSQDPSIPSSPQSLSDIGFAKAPLSQYNNYPVPKQGAPATRHTPIHVHSSSNTTDLSSPSQQELAQSNQPLYANAPPKPKRLNDFGYSSPSPDTSERYPGHDATYAQAQYYNNRQMRKSPVCFYNNSVPVEYIQRYHNPPEYLVQNAERRTPDTYGPSSQANATIKMCRHATDYEDIYTEQYMYKRPLSPLAYTMKKDTNTAATMPPMQRPYIPPSASMQEAAFDSSQLAYIPKKHAPNVPRPHSADFLEYEAISNRQQQQLVQRQSRPKSSLDINRSPSSDNYFYSEERYAEKMRKSAQYLPHTRSNYVHDMNALQRRQQLQQQQQLHHTAPMARTTANLVMMSPNPVVVRTGTPIRSRSVLSEGSLCRELDGGDVCYSPSERLNRSGSGLDMNEAFSPTTFVPHEQYAYDEAEVRRHEYEQFARSASARVVLNNNEHRSTGDGSSGNFCEGDRKREESMKRLLEWKQRMLQSPLNRKMNQNIGKIYPSPAKQEIYAKNQTDPGMRIRIQQDPYFQNSRPKNTSMQYNSYSSDDEENVADDHCSRREAGWTATSHTAHTAAVATDTTLLPMLDTRPIGSEHLKPLVPPHKADALNKPLQLSNKQTTHLAHVSSLRSEQTRKEDHRKTQSFTASTTEIKTNGALVKSILAEFEKQNTPTVNTTETTSGSDSVTPTNEVVAIVEENYMPMTAKKNILDPQCIIANVEENPYVEMAQGIDLSMSQQTKSMVGETYELVAFTNGKMEPLYMELRQPDSFAGLKTLAKNIADVKLASNSPATTKSDSSDADDEASKDLDGLEAPSSSRPRFSLSDTFRPASYYLGVTQSSEHQDSSDSELVSPPPIPRSPPPLEDLRKSDELNDRKDATKHTFLSFNSFGKDDLSTCSDNERSYGRRLSQTSNSSDIERRTIVKQRSDYERMLKRRPLSERYRDELYSFSAEQLNETIDSDELDKYLKELQISNVSLPSTADSNRQFVRNFVNSSCTENRFHDYENLCVTNQNKLDLNISLLSPIAHFCDNNKELDESRKSYDSPLDRSTLSVDIIPRTMGVSDISENSFHLNITGRQSSPSKLMSAREIAMPMTFGDLKPRDADISGMSLSQPAPYYYSDLSMNALHTDLLTLNNKRESMNGNKRDISHIINPIRCGDQLRNSITNGQDPPNKLASEARSVSVDFLNLTDKSGHIDKKNIYESDTLKRLKAGESIRQQQSGESRNLLVFNNNKFVNNNNDGILRRTHSLEGLLENVFTSNECTWDVPTSPVRIPPRTREKGRDPLCRDQREINVTTEGSYLWEEDVIWRERLRSASQRHTKSMDDLDFIGSVKNTTRANNSTSPTRKIARAITRDVTYVNDNIYNMLVREKSPDRVTNPNSVDSTSSTTAVTVNNGVNTLKTTAPSGCGADRKDKDSFSIDREKLRQWDLMSSAPSESQPGDQSVRVSLAEVDPGDRVTGTQSIDSCEQPESASGSVSVHIRDTFPRAISAKQIWTPNHHNMSSKSYTNLSLGNEADYVNSLKQGYCPNSQGPRPHPRTQADMKNYNSRKEHLLKMKVSAGELLGRTHEELVLLLIQLRRQSTSTCHAIEACYNEIDSIQAQLHLMDAAKRIESLQKLEQIKQHLLELERQYEKGKPLVNLVDNMVKLGSLYRSPNERTQQQNADVRYKLEFNQQVQERRLLAEERRDWHRIIPNHSQLQEKVQQLYQLDRLISEESGTLQNLQQDKEEIERALGGLRDRLVKGFADPIMIEQARKQQLLLENELSRVHLMLAQNSKKLEETVVGNARLEQELLVLKQKLQLSRQNRSSPQISNAGDSLPCVGSSAILESDLQRVQQNVGDLQRQRQELSMQVRQLTDRSHNLCASNKQSGTNSTFTLQALGNKKKLQSLWRETDLDTMNIIDHSESTDFVGLQDSTPTSDLKPQMQLHQQQPPPQQQMQLQQQQPPSPDRDLFYQTDEDQSNPNLAQEKPEPKTVRIVKRESERRQRDREKGSGTVKWESLQEEEDATVGVSVINQRPQQQHQQLRPTTLLPGGTPYKLIAGSAPNLDELSPLVANIDTNSGVLSRQSSLSSPSLPQNFLNVKVKQELQQQSKQNQGPLELSPVYKSDAAKQIITEMSNTGSTAKPSASNISAVKTRHKRAVPIEKRRHYTAPHNNMTMMVKSLNQLPTDESMFGKDGGLPERRARDDLDMERALRQRIDAPDVVRSTLSGKELKYNENTIDSLLGAPSKINIPERYIPEQSPQLSAEEQEMRLRKVESIKKMLSDTALISSAAGTASNNASENSTETTSTLANKATSKMIEEKKQREHLLQLNQILAKQVMEMSKIVAVKALSKLPYEDEEYSDDEEPADPLPIYQQRDNFYS